MTQLVLVVLSSSPGRYGVGRSRLGVVRVSVRRDVGAEGSARTRTACEDATKKFVVRLAASYSGSPAVSLPAEGGDDPRPLLFFGTKRSEKPPASSREGGDSGAEELLDARGRLTASDSVQRHFEMR
jgi:hypothetical protein